MVGCWYNHIRSHPQGEWKVPRNLHQQFWRNFFHCGGLGKSRVSSQGMWAKSLITISQVKVWNHPIETTTYKWLFRVPGIIYLTMHSNSQPINSRRWFKRQRMKVPAKDTRGLQIWFCIHVYIYIYWIYFAYVNLPCVKFNLIGVKWLNIPGNLEWHWIDWVLTWFLTLWFNTKPKTYSITKLRVPQWPSIPVSWVAQRIPCGLFLRWMSLKQRGMFRAVGWYGW